MIDNEHSNDVENKENDVNFDVEVVDYVYKNRFVRREQLIDHFVELHNGERGYTRPSVERKITRLKNMGVLIIVKHPKLEKYGIYDKAKNASYITVNEIIDTYNYLDTLFSYFKSDENCDKDEILIEFDLYKDRYSLNREQLDVLVDCLATDDENLQTNLIRILRDYILYRGITPTNEEKLLKTVNNILCNFSKVPGKYESSITYLIFILGYYNSDSVIDWLKYDLINPNIVDRFEKIRNDYSSIYTARVIDRNKLELFNLINDLKKEGKEEEAKVIRNVKYEAAKALGHIKEEEVDDSW